MKWFAKGYTKTGIYVTDAFEASNLLAAKRKARAELLKLNPVSKHFCGVYVYNEKYPYVKFCLTK